MGDDTEWMKLSTEQKLQHTSWKARQAGYDELKKLFEQQTDEKSPEYTKYGSMLKKAVADTNAVAQDRALIAVETYLRTASAQIIGRFAPEFCGPIVQKCVGAARNSTKEKAFELLLTVIELEKGEAVFEAVFEGLQTKQPKLLVGCLQLLRLAVQQFGVPVCPAKPMVKEAMRLIEDRDKAVREECKALLTDIARYVGAVALKQQLSTLNEIVQKQLEAEFATLTERAVPTRFTRSQQAARASNPAAAAIGGGAAPSGGQAAPKVAELDPFSLMEAVDVLKAVPSDFFDKIEAKKWQERKEAIEAVEKPLHNAPKLADGDYGRLVGALSKVLQKDVNVMCAGLAAQCLTLLARGLRNKFSPWARDLITDCLFERLKERKLTTQLRDCLDAAFAATSYQLDSVGESTLKELENKNPTVKCEIALFLSRSFLKMNTTTLPKKWLKPVTAALTRTAGDGDPQVREASFEALGAAMRCVGERNIAPFLSELDEARSKKIHECFEKLAPESAGASGSAPAAKPGAPAKSEPASASEQPKGAGLLSTLKPVGAAAGSKRPTTAPASGATAPASSSTVKSGAAPKAAPKAAPPKKGDADLLHNESDLSESEVDTACSQLFGPDIVTQMVDADRKTRLAAVEAVQSKLKQLLVSAGDDPSRVPTQAIVRLLARKPGLRDSNIQILKIKLDSLRSLLDSDASRLSQSTTSIFLIDAAVLLGDTKHADTVRAILLATAEHCSLEFVAREVLTFAFPSDTGGATKEKEGGTKAPVASPKVQEALLLLVASGLRDFGMQVPLKILIDTLRTAIASSNAAVRAAAFTLTGVVGAFVGAPRVRANFEADQKPAVLAQLDAEFEKQKDAVSVAPTRMLRGKKRLALLDGPAGVAKFDGDSKNGQPSAAAPVPVQEEEDPYTMDEPVDVLKAIPADVFEKAEAKKWQERKEALESVEKLLHNAPRLADGEYAPLVAMLSKCAQKDVNVMCAGLALQCLTLLARGLRTKFSQFARDLFGETLIDRFKERKLTTQLRDLFDAAIASLGYSLEPVGEELLARLEAAKSPTAKQELALFLARIFVHSRFVVTRCLPKGGFLKALITPLLRFANDGDPQVREAAFEVLGAALRGVGERPLTPLLAEMDEQKMKRVREHFEKLGGAKQPQAAAQAPVPAKPQASAAPAAAPPKPQSQQSPPKPAISKHGSEENLLESNNIVKRPQTAPAKKEPAKKEPAGTKPAPSAEAEESAAKKADEGILFDAAHAAKDQRMRDEFGSAASRKAGPSTQLSCITKGVRWDFVYNMQHASREHQDALRTQLEAHANRDLIESLLNFTDFKMQLKALDALLRFLSDATVTNFVANLDVLFKTLTLLNFENNNSTLLLKSLELLQALLGRLVAMQPRYTLTDYETLLLVPLLLVKLHDSSNNQTAKDKLKSLVLRELTLLCPAARVFTFTLDSIGKKELKNAKFRIDCVELLHALVELFSFNVCATGAGGPGTLKQICSLLTEQRDTAMRVALVQLLVLVNAQVGDAEFARHVSPLLAEKDAQMLEDRKSRARRPGAATTQLSQLAQSASSVHGSAIVPAPQSVAAAPVQQLPVAASGATQVSHAAPSAAQSNAAPGGDDGAGRFHFSSEWDMKPFECELPGLPQIDLAPIFAPFEMPRIVSTRIGAFGERMNTAQLNTLLAELGSARIEESVSALVRLKDVLDDAPIADRVLADDSEALNRIVMCIAQQLGTLLVRYVDSAQSQSTDPAETRLVKLLLGTVTNVIDYPKVQPAQNTSANGTHHYTLVTQLNADVLHKLCAALCIMLADDRVHAQFEKSTSTSSQTDLENAGRSAQAILGRLVEHAACTAMLTALCRLVADSARSLMLSASGPTSTERFFDVVTRCTTRFLRRLNAINEKQREQDELCIEEVFLDLDRFLRECPTAAWKSKAAPPGAQSNSNKPFRLLRTIVYQLVTLKGVDSLRIAQLTLQKDSELLGIINKSVKKAAKTNQAVAEVSGVTTASLREQLAQIFVRIGAKEMAQDGLVELFHFRKRHPQIDVNAFLEKAGENFQKFVSISLRNIELEEELRRSRDTIRELNRRAAPGGPNELLAATELDSPMEPIPEEIFTHPEAIRPFFAKRFESFGLRFAVDANANFNFETTLSLPLGTSPKEALANDTALNLMDLSVAPHLDTTLQRAEVERPSEPVAERPAVQQADLVAIQRRLAELRSGKK